MNVYTCDDHDNVWVGGASVIIAETEDRARELLDAELKQRGLRGSDLRPYTLRRLSATIPGAYVLHDGNY